MVFRAHELREGSSPDEMRRQLNEALKLIERDLVTALSRPRVSELITASSYAASFGEVVRVAPPSGGLSLLLPEPNLARLDARITVVQEAASGAMTVEVVNGTINGGSTLAYLAGLGTVEFILTPEGWYAWSVSLVASFPLTGLAAQAANTIVANATGASASPTAVAVSADSLLARVGGNLVSHPWSTVAGAGLTYSAGVLAVGAGTGITVNANDVAVSIPLTDGDKGDITVATSGTAWSIDANAVTNAKLAQMATATVKGRALGAGTGDPTDLTAAQLMDLLEPEAATWTGNWNLNNRVRLTSEFSQTLTGNTDDLAIGAVSRVRLVGNTFNLTGMVPNADGHLVWLQNADAADALVLVHDATSTAANRLPRSGFSVAPRSMK